MLKGDQDAFMISSVSEMYLTAVICLYLTRDSLCVACRFWLPCHISKKSYTLAILFNFGSSSSFLISESFSVFVVSITGSLPAKIPLLARANCLTMTFWRRVSPVVFCCLQLIIYGPRDILDSTPTPCGMIEYMACATLERSGYFLCISSCWRHQCSYVQYPKCTANPHWVAVVIIEIWINLPPVLWCFRWWIQIEPGGSQ